MQETLFFFPSSDYGNDCVTIYGVEPETANTMFLSLRDDGPVSLPNARSIASGLAPPFAGQNAFNHVRAFCGKPGDVQQLSSSSNWTQVSKSISQ